MQLIKIVILFIVSIMILSCDWNKQKPGICKMIFDESFEVIKKIPVFGGSVRLGIAPSKDSIFSITNNRNELDYHFNIHGLSLTNFKSIECDSKLSEYTNETTKIYTFHHEGKYLPEGKNKVICDFSKIHKFQNYYVVEFFWSKNKNTCRAHLFLFQWKQGKIIFIDKKGTAIC